MSAVRPKHFAEITLIAGFHIFPPVWIRNRIISAGLEPILSQTEKLCLASYYKQFSMNIEIKNHKN